MLLSTKLDILKLPEKAFGHNYNLDVDMKSKTGIYDNPETTRTCHTYRLTAAVHKLLHLVCTMRLLLFYAVCVCCFLSVLWCNYYGPQWNIMVWWNSVQIYHTSCMKAFVACSLKLHLLLRLWRIPIFQPNCCRCIVDNVGSRKEEECVVQER